MSLSFPTMAAIRFGYGLRPGEALPQTKDDLIAQVTRGAGSVPRFPVGGIEARRAALLDLQDRLKQIRQTDRDDLDRRQQRRLLQRRAQMLFQMDANARLMQAVLSPDGFNQRLATFWTNHFSTSAAKSLPMRLIVPLYEAEAIRPYMGGKFATLLRRATEHPSMLIYLDQAQSLGPDPKAACGAIRD
ncbi:hypothetical protein FHT92_001798 [Rhizobium sp. BK377]|nr:hypothetical protein [Rhizobium sp. BK377]